MTEFDDDTRVEAVAANDFAATVTARWNAIGGRPNGGYLLGICAQALRQTASAMGGGFPDPLAVSGFFHRAAVVGPARVVTETIRSGRRLATVQARLLQDDREVMRALATFTDLTQATGRTLILSEAPKLPSPTQSLDPLAAGAFAEITITDRFDYRVPVLPGWMRGRPTGDPSMTLWLRFKDGRPPDSLALVAMVDGAYPAVLEIGEPASSTVQLTVHVRARPAPGWLACRVTTRHVIGGYHEEDFEIWDADGKLVAQSRQLALLAQG
jgi:acyl-CoA thioesterase